MADGILTPAVWHDHDIDFARWLHPTMLWDDMPLNSPKRPPYWNSTSGFDFDHITAVDSHSAPVSEILSKLNHRRQKKMTSCRFLRWRISAILDFRDPIMASLKSPNYITSYKSLIDIIAVNCLVFEKIAFLGNFGRQTGQHQCTTPLSLSLAAA